MGKLNKRFNQVNSQFSKLTTQTKTEKGPKNVNLFFIIFREMILKSRIMKT